MYLLYTTFWKVWIWQTADWISRSGHFKGLSRLGLCQGSQSLRLANSKELH